MRDKDIGQQGLEVRQLPTRLQLTIPCRMPFTEPDNNPGYNRWRIYGCLVLRLTLGMMVSSQAGGGFPGIKH